VAAPQKSFMPENDPADRNLEELGYGATDAPNVNASKRMADKRRKRSGFSGWLRSLILTLFLIGIVVGSFWVAFNLGANMLSPVRKLTGEKKVEPQKTKEKPKALIERLDHIFEQELEKVKEIDQKGKEPAKAIALPPEKAAVKIEPVKETSTVYPAGKYFVQAGVFSHINNAMTMVSNLEEKGLNASYERYGKYYRVKVGNKTDRNTALKLAQRTRSLGFEAIVVDR
jgi:hypothetical protein